MSRHLVTTKASPRLCPRCREVLLVGVSGGLTVRVDPYPIDREIEAVAILVGRRTYTLSNRELIFRDGGHRISGPVLAEHACGNPLRGKPPPPPAPPCYVPPF